MLRIDAGLHSPGSEKKQFSIRSKDLESLHPQACAHAGRTIKKGLSKKILRPFFELPGLTHDKVSPLVNTLMR